MGSNQAGVIFWMGAILIFLMVTVHCEDVKDMSAACIKDKALTEDQGKAVTDDSIFTAKDVPENVKCYYMCMYQKRGLIDAAGKPSGAKILQYLKDTYKDIVPKIPAIMTKCSAIAKTSKTCDATFKFENCVQKETKAAAA